MVVSALVANWQIAVGLLAVGLLVYWTLDERRMTSSAGETIERVGARAESVTGGVVGAFGSLVVVLISIAMTVGMEVASTGGDIVPLVTSAPVVVGHTLFGLLTFLGLTGTVPLTTVELGWLFLIITAIALALRFGGEPSGS
jgi:hypothetical protein